MRNALSLKTLHRYLNLVDVRTPLIDIDRIYSSHPLPDSLRAVSDTLDALGIKNEAYIIPLNELSNQQIPALLFFEKYTPSIGIFEGVDGEGKVTMWLSGQGVVTIDKDDLTTYWNGVVLSSTVDSGNHKCFGLLYFLKQFLWHLSRPISILLMTFFLMSFTSIVIVRGGSIINLLFFMLCIAGVLISAVGLVKKYSSPTSNTCSCIGIGNCRAFDNILGWTSLGELSLAFFSSLFIWNILALHLYGNFSFIFSVLSLPFVCLSVIQQITKKFVCHICVAIDITLILLMALSLYAVCDFSIGFTYACICFIGFAAFFLLFLLVIKLICSGIEAKLNSEKLRQKHASLICNIGLFEYFLSTEETFLSNEEVEAISLSNNVSGYNHHICAIISPNCQYCGQLVEILPSLENCLVSLIFSVDNGDNPGKLFVMRLFSFALLGHTWIQITGLLRDWFSGSNNLIDFNILPEVETLLSKHSAFCTNCGIKKTPTVFVDGKLLPDVYGIDDLPFIL